MEQVFKHIVDKYDALIQELQALEEANNAFLEKATKEANVPMTEMQPRMRLARDNHRRLQIAMAEREHIIETYIRG